MWQVYKFILLCLLVCAVPLTAKVKPISTRLILSGTGSSEGSLWQVSDKPGNATFKSTSGLELDVQLKNPTGFQILEAINRVVFSSEDLAVPRNGFDGEFSRGRLDASRVPLTLYVNDQYEVRSANVPFKVWDYQVGGEGELLLDSYWESALLTKKGWEVANYAQKVEEFFGEVSRSFPTYLLRFGSPNAYPAIPLRMAAYQGKPGSGGKERIIVESDFRSLFFELWLGNKNSDAELLAYYPDRKGLRLVSPDHYKRYLNVYEELQLVGPEGAMGAGVMEELTGLLKQIDHESMKAAAVANIFNSVRPEFFQSCAASIMPRGQIGFSEN